MTVLPDMRRRAVIRGAAAMLGTAVLPSCAPRRDARLLRFSPQADLASLDPIWTTAGVTRTHGFLVYDTLFGLDADFRPQPQMIEGFECGADGRRWTLRLREGLRFHDGAPVRARDCVASLARWSQRDAMGQALFAAADEVTAQGERDIVFRLREPFALLPDALAKVGVNVPFIMPERHALTSPFVQVAEVVGSGPYRFLPDERIVGARAAYARFGGYVPREGGKAAWTSGPKRARFERVEWTVIPDPATASIALRNGEIDWLETPSLDLLPLIAQDRALALPEIDPTGAIAVLRPNHLWPPFDNPAIRRALLRVVRQEPFLAAAGFGPEARRAGVGIFPPGTPLATDAGLDLWDGPPDYARARAEIRAAGYAGEPVVVLGTTDPPILRALAEVGADLLRRCGFAVDYQVMDWNALIQRRARRGAPPRGGRGGFFFPRARGGLLQTAGPPSPRRQRRGGRFRGAPPPPPGGPSRVPAARAGPRGRPARPGGKGVPGGGEPPPATHTLCRPELTGLLHGLPLFWNVERAGHA